MRRLVPSLLAVLACSLGLAACGGGGSGDGPSVAGFCKTYLTVQDKTNALSDATGASLEERKTALAAFAQSLQDLADDSPEEVQSDVQETADWATGAEEAVADEGSVKDFEKAGTAYGKANPQPQEASQRADTFQNKNCGGGDTGSGTDSTDSTDSTSG